MHQAPCDFFSHAKTRRTRREPDVFFGFLNVHRLFSFASSRLRVSRPLMEDHRDLSVISASPWLIVHLSLTTETRRARRASCGCPSVISVSLWLIVHLSQSLARCSVQHPLSSPDSCKSVTCSARNRSTRSEERRVGK